MRALIAGMLLCTTGICLAMDHTIKPVIRYAKNDEQIISSLSSHDINRLFVDKDKITAINAPGSRISAHNDESGSVYINVNGEEPFTLFITTQSKRHFSLLVTPKAEPGVTLEIKPSTPISYKDIRRSHHHSHMAHASSYESTLVKLISSTMNDEIPDGYSEINDASTAGQSFHRKGAQYNKDLTAKLLHEYIGNDLSVKVITIKNTSKRNIHISANDFYQKNTRAIAIDNELIQPSQTSIVYEVVSDV